MELLSSLGPIFVLNIKLNCSIFSNSELHFGHFSLFFLIKSFISFTLEPSTLAFNFSSMKWSALISCLHFEHLTIMSSKFSTWPEACHTLGWVIMLPSMPTISSLCCTWYFHHSAFMLFFNSTPRCPKSQNPAKPPYSSELG